MMKAILILPIVLFFLTGNAYSEVLMTTKDFLKKELAGGSEKLTIAKEDIQLDDKAAASLKEIVADLEVTKFTFYYGKGADGQIKKACSVIPQKGKEGPMAVGICWTAAGTVDDVVILNFVEDHGKPVKEEAFIKQFRGKSVTDAFTVGKDINGWSGATNSSKAVSEAVRKTGFVMKNFVLKK